MKKNQQAKKCPRVIFKILLTSFIYCLFTITVHAQTEKVNLAYSNTPVKTILNDIEKQSNYFFIYNHQLVDVERRININVKNMQIKEVLRILFSESDVRYETVNRQIVLSPKNMPSPVSSSGTIAAEYMTQLPAGTNNNTTVANKAAQTGITVRGSVFDETGMPCLGVAVVLKENSSKYATTDIDGKFELNGMEENAVLVFSHIGYETLEVPVGSRSVLTVKLRQVINMLQDVVVTGYQTISKERSAGAFNVIQGNNIKEKAMLSGNILSSMEGLTTGLSVNNSGGGDKFLIRGVTSINSARSPLFVVDGVPLQESIVESLINANDVASISILKDATAASIWGSQAANGVVVITTKKGVHNQPLNVHYDGSFSFIGKPDYDYQNRMDGTTFIKNAQEVFDMYSQVYNYNAAKTTDGGIGVNTNTPIVFPHEQLMYQYANGEISLAERDAALAALAAQNGRANYEDQFMSNRLFTQHTLSFNGGGEKHTYYASLNYRGDQGLYQSWSDRINLNTRQELQLTNWLKWEVGLNASYSNSNEKVLPWGSLGTPSRDFPYMLYTDGQGMVDHSMYYVYEDKRNSVEQLTESDMSFYPVEDFNRTSLNAKSTNIRFNTGLVIDLPAGLRYESRLQYSSLHTKSERYLPEKNWLVREERLRATKTGTTNSLVPSTGGHFTLSNGYETDWTLRNQLSYNKNFDDTNHQLTALAGTEVRAYKPSSYTSFLRGYDMQTMLYTPYDIYALSRANFTPVYGRDVVAGSFNTNYYSQGESSRRYFSLYANGAYTYLRRYTLNASLRIDQSNLFGSDPSMQYRPIWSVGGAWKMSEEGFMQGQSLFNDLTFRLSYGLAGNSPSPGQGGRYDIITAISNAYFETTGFEISSPANKQITWEKTRTVNIGVDARLLDNRLDLSFDYYDKKTTDLLGYMSLNPTSGRYSTIGNLGTLTNKGVELSLNTHNIKGNDFNWYTNLTFSYNQNKIVELLSETPYTHLDLTAGFSQYIEGYSASSLFAYRYAGLDGNGHPQVIDRNGKIIAGTNSSSLTPEDVVYMGTTVPKYYGGLGNRFTYKSLELSFLFVYNLGHVMRGDVNNFYYGRPTGNLHNDFDKRWRKSGDEAFTDIPKYTVDATTDNNTQLYARADVNVLDASYVKLRDISLSWNVEPQICQKMRVSSMKLTVQAANLFYIAANGKGIDPEAYAINYRTDRYGPTYSVGLTINF